MEVPRVPASLYYYATFIENICSCTVYRIFSNSFFLGGRGGGHLLEGKGGDYLIILAFGEGANLKGALI